MIRSGWGNGDSGLLFDADDVRRTLTRIAHEIVERNPSGPIALVGIHGRGVPLAARIQQLLIDRLKRDVWLGELDIAFHRDDYATRLAPEVRASYLPFRLERQTVVLVDDVLYTGRTVRAAIGALFDYGRPPRVQLAVLVDRGHRELPFRPDYVGKNLLTSRSQHVRVRLTEIDGIDEVRLEGAKQ